ncbi:MAG: Mu-like prophage major head subunit gpT family protein [Pyrinomonadaceae bacterium]
MATMVRASFPDWMTTAALPFLRRIVESGRKKRPEWFQDVYRMESTDRPHEQYTSIAKFGTFVETDEGASVTYDSALQGFDKTLTPLQYSLGFKVSRIAFDDDRIGPLKNMARDLGWSWTESRNILSADIFNNGFNSSFTGADGLELFSTAHIREDGVAFRNELATSADFSITSLRTAFIDFRNFRDGRGKRLNLSPESILIPADGYFDVAEVLQSTDRPDTANRAKNVTPDFFGQGMLAKIIVSDYLTDTDAFFLIGPKDDHGLVFLEREPFSVENDVDFDSRTLKTAAWGRFDVDWVNNGVGVYGSPGA